MTYPDNPYQSHDNDGLPVTPPPAPQMPIGYQAPQQNPFGQPQQGYVQPQFAAPMVQAAPKQMIAAALLAFFLGPWGAHNFYLGYTNRAVTQLVLTLIGFFTSFVLIGIPVMIGVSIWALVEFIMILVGSSPFDRDATGRPLSR